MKLLPGQDGRKRVEVTGKKSEVFKVRRDAGCVKRGPAEFLCVGGSVGSVAGSLVCLSVVLSRCL